MPIQLTPPTKVKCTYNDCLQSFDTLKEMKAHKLSEPDHNYCKKCDVDCGDWDDFTQHKVNAMAPWLEGSNKEDRGENPKHIVCEFCGEDFKSFGGRKLHRKQVSELDFIAIATELTLPRCTRLCSPSTALAVTTSSSRLLC